MTESKDDERIPWTNQELAPIRDKVYSYIKNAILRGEYKAGDRLVERNLADKLQISRTPIREALFRLESQRFVTTVPRKGVIVNEISRDEILEVFLILASLETLAVRLAAQKIGENMAAEFDELIEEIKAIQAKGSDAVLSEEFAEINLRYNDLIGKAAKNNRLHEMLTELRDYVRAFSNVSAAVPGRALEALKEHLDILISIRDSEADLAENYAKIHLQKSKKAYMHPEPEFS
jgi:DNA-binding GntR family transcriptional regulator